MKNQFIKLTLAIFVIFGTMGLSTTANAWNYWFAWGWHPRHYVHYSQAYVYKCKWISEHWAYGVWYPAQKVCWVRR